MTSEPRQFCTFYIDQHRFGVPVETVHEILRCQAVTPVPLAPREVRGLINLRGQIVTVIDLRRRLRLPDREQPLATNVIVQTSDEVVSLLVDEMGNVQSVQAGQFALPPDTLRGIPRQLITGTYKLPESLLLLLDVARVVDLSESPG
jgi:purine-binding chemotaxis protein CheW